MKLGASEKKLTRMMSGKSKSSSLTSSPARSASVCGDCGAGSPSWVSLNRGIFMCLECASVHRSMGRHISQVKLSFVGISFVQFLVTICITPVSND